MPPTLTRILAAAGAAGAVIGAAVLGGGGPALAASAAGTQTRAATATRATAGWVGTWESAQVQPATTGLSATGFSDQTVRDIVHTSAGGSEIRIRLSNVFGTKPLAIVRRGCPYTSK